MSVKYQKEHKKSTLLRWNKQELVDYIIMLEHNINVVQEGFNNQYNNCLILLDNMKIMNETYSKNKSIIEQTLSKGDIN